MKTNSIFILIFIILLGAACERETQRHSLLAEQTSINQPTNTLIAADNKLRQELGLKVIGQDWILYRADNGQEDWKIRKDGFPAKVVFKDSQRRVLADEDYYYSGNEFYDAEGHGWERVTVHYDYPSKQVYVAYTGTNKPTETALSKYFITIGGASSDVVGAMTAVRKIVADWPKKAVNQ